MKRLLLTILLILPFLASHGQHQREGIQWGEIHFVVQDSLGLAEEAWLLFTYSDGTVDSLEFSLWHPTVPEEFFYSMFAGEIEEEDFNFDGIPDLQICLGYTHPMVGNLAYLGFVWDLEKSVFVEVPEYADIYNPTVSDSCIISITHDYEFGRINYYEYEVYQWIDGKLVVTESRLEWTDYDDE